MVSRYLTAAHTGIGMDMSDTSTFSRPTTLGWGKATEPVKGMVPVEVKEPFARRWRELGYSSESDCVRELVVIFTFGSDFLQKLHAERIKRMADRMAGIVQEVDQ